MYHVTFHPKINIRVSDSDDEGCTHFKAVSCMGCQPGSDVYVFGPNLQVSSEGRIIPETEQEYVWVPEIIKKIGCVINPVTALPTIHQPLKNVTNGLLKISGSNLPSAIYVAGKWVLLHGCFISLTCVCYIL